MKRLSFLLLIWALLVEHLNPAVLFPRHSLADSRKAVWLSHLTHSPPERRLSDKSRKSKEKKWSPDAKSMDKLEKYAVTSLMTMISLKIAGDSSTEESKKSLAARSRKLGAIGQFVKGNSLESSFAKQKKDLGEYLRNHNVAVRKNISLQQMEGVMRRYMKDRFHIRPAQFNMVKDLIGGIHRVSQRLRQKNNV
jgi:hypothetical protein